MNFYVYAHLNPISLKPFYIGKGKDGRMFNETDRNRFWRNTVNKYGFIPIKLVDGLTERAALEIEKIYIQKYKLRSEGGLLVNLTQGGAGGNTIGDHNRQAFLKKCSEQKLGSKNPNYGKPTWLKGRNVSEQQKETLRQLRLGKKLDPEVKIKVLAGLKKAAEASLKSRTHKVQCLITGKVWDNRQECVKEIGITIDCFKSWIYKNKPMRGYHLQLIKKLL